jgi:PAS domain-containing protein
MIGMGYERSRVFDALPRLVWTAPAGGHIDFLNRRWCEYTGFGSEEAYDRGWQTAPTLKTEALPELPECGVISRGL